MDARQQYNLLMIEVGSNQFEAAECLLMSGVSPNIDDINVDTCLHIATHNKNLKMVQMLLYYKADVKKLDSAKYTALDIACANSDWDTAAVLIAAHKSGASNISHVVLLAAVRAGVVGIVESLLAKGVSPNTDEANVDSCLHVAVKQFKESTLGIAEKKIITLLLEYGADLTKQNGSKLTPIECADIAGIELITALRNTDADDKAHYGSKLIDAASANNIKLATKLLIAGSSTTWQHSNTEYRSLHHAVSNNNPKMITLLRIYGAGTTVTEKSGKTPYQLAVAKRHWECGRALTVPLVTGKDFYEYMAEGKQSTELQGCKNPDDYLHLKDAVVAHMLRLPQDQKLAAFANALKEDHLLHIYLTGVRNPFSSLFNKTSENTNALARIRAELAQMGEVVKEEKKEEEIKEEKKEMPALS